MVSPVMAQIGGIGDGGACSCARVPGSTCCGCGQAKAIWELYCQVGDPENCNCQYCGSSDRGSCGPTSHASCACGGSDGGTGGGGSGGGCPACFSGISNCGEVGRPGGSGSCGGGEICCGDFTCNPSCGSPRCGGSDGCGGSCSNADNGSPPTPTISTPTEGGIALMDPDTLEITVDWNNTNKADRYQVQIFPVGSTDCSDAGAVCATVNSSQYRFVPAQVLYQVRVRAINTDCGTDYSAWTASTNFSVHAPVTGTLYLDNDTTSALNGSMCSTGSGTCISSSWNFRSDDSAKW